MTAARAVTGGILKVTNLPEILPVYLVDRLCLSVVVAGNKYCIFGQVQGGKLIAISGKFATVSHGIWQTGPQNLKKFAVEDCAAYSGAVTVFIA